MRVRSLLLTLVCALCMLPFYSCNGGRRHAAACDDENRILCGGYTEFRALTEAELDMFDRLVSQLDGPKYDAEQVSTQVVNGTNYRFLASSAQDEQVIITIYAPLPGNGEPQITSIEKID